ncbi:MAG TPA: phosphatase PAP2 family protein [Acidimicrobiales bacterium]|nr:phosphatase PAP2 family protein [Acidimicrobiales bacterium]
MAVVIACLGVGLLAAVPVAIAVARWPRLDPTAPRVDPAHLVHEVEAHPRVRSALHRHVDPREVMGAVLGVAIVVVIAATAAFGLLLFMVREHLGAARVDNRAGRWAASHATEHSTEFLRFLTRLGGTEWGLVLLAFVLVVETRRARNRAVISFLLLTVVGQNLIVNGSKFLIDRARPDINRLTGFSSSSFPSGHAAQAAAMFAAFALLLGRRRSRTVRAVLAGLAVWIAVSVAASRVLLGAHWFTDVLAGLAVGWGWFALVSVAFGGRWLHFGAPVEEAEMIADELENAPERSAGHRHGAGRS